MRKKDARAKASEVHTFEEDGREEPASDSQSKKSKGRDGEWQPSTLENKNVATSQRTFGGSRGSQDSISFEPQLSSSESIEAEKQTMNEELRDTNQGQLAEKGTVHKPRNETCEQKTRQL